MRNAPVLLLAAAFSLPLSAAKITEYPLSASATPYTKGGGVWSHGFGYLHNVDVAENWVTDSGSTGGGVYSEGSAFLLADSIVHANANHVSSTADNCSGSGMITSNGFNIVGDTTGCFISGAVNVADPLVGPLSDHGGPTLTYVPGAGSPAIDGGNPTGFTDPSNVPLVNDQRGVKRPLPNAPGAKCDLGALGRCNVNAAGGIDVADIFYLINFLFAGGPAPMP